MHTADHRSGSESGLLALAMRVLIDLSPMSQVPMVRFQKQATRNEASGLLGIADVL